MAEKRQQLPVLIAAPDTMPVPEILRRARSTVPGLPPGSQACRALRSRIFEV